MECLLCLLSGQCKTLVTRAIAYCGPQPLGVEIGPRTYRMAGVQLDGIAQAMLPRLPSRGWRLLCDGFGSKAVVRRQRSARRPFTLTAWSSATADIEPAARCR